MTSTHIHLIVNHLALYWGIGTLIAVYLFHRGLLKIEKKHICWINIGLLVIVIAVVISGHGAEESAASFLQDNDGSKMHNHEEWGEMARNAVFLNAIFSFLVIRKPESQIFWKLMIGTLILSVLLMSAAAFFGGILAHPELR